MREDSNAVGIDEASRLIEEELLPGERLLWADKPRTGIRLAWADLAALPVGLIVFSGGLLFVVVSLRSEPDVAGVLVGAYAVAFGLFISTSRLLTSAWRRGRTAYGVTTRRVIVVRNALSYLAKSQDLDTLSNLGMKKKKDGTGEIAFGPWGHDEAVWKMRFHPYAPMPSLAFEELANCAEVYDVIVKARAEVRQQQSI
jgi:hypothetical protein